MTATDEDVRLLLEKRPGWNDALMRLGELHRTQVEKATEEAAQYANLYRGHRAAMVFDVVASRQRRYVPRVRHLVDRFQQTPAAASIHSIAELGPGEGYGLRHGEAETMRNVAWGLIEFGKDTGLQDDDEIVECWAETVEPLEVAPELDPYVGAVKGIGLALFCYMRMRSGADAIKPDVRVRRALETLGFVVPHGELALLVVASVLARELGVTRLVLDQLLWWTGNSAPSDGVNARALPDDPARPGGEQPQLPFHGYVVDIRRNIDPDSPILPITRT